MLPFAKNNSTTQSLRITVLILLSCVLCLLSATAQVDNMDYNRSGITFVNYSKLKWGYTPEFDQAFADLKTIPNRYDNNLLPVEITNSVREMEGQNVAEKMQNAGVPYFLVNYLFDEKDGFWSMDRFFERAAYNLSDAEVMTLKNSFRGLHNGIQDAKWSEPIIRNNFIIALQMTKFTAWKEYYDDIDAANKAKAAQDKNYTFTPVKREYTGYSGVLTGHIYRLDLNDEVMNHIYMNCWADESSTFEEIQAAEGARVMLDYPLVHVASVSSAASGMATSTQPSVSRLMNYLLGHMYEAMIKELNQFKVKATIYNYQKSLVRKAHVKIGTKEDLRKERRFFVYEQKAKANGDVKLVRKGAVRATVISDNNAMASGTTIPSQFVQIAGGRLSEGMLIQENPDLGIYLHPQYGSHGLNIRASVSVSQGMSSPISGLRVWMEVGGKDRDYGALPNYEDPYEPYYNDRVGLQVQNLYSVIVDDTSALDDALDRELASDHIFRGEETKARMGYFGIGMSKEICIMGNFSLEPYAGIRIGGTSFNDEVLEAYLDEDAKVTIIQEYDHNYDGIIDSTVFDPVGYNQKVVSFDAGLNLTVNITPWVQLVGTVGYTQASQIKNGKNDIIRSYSLPATVYNEATPFGEREYVENPAYTYENPLYFRGGLRWNF